ncbi:MAG: hypothetical protein WC473_03600 [Patescibacteria group bacterium]
MVYATIICIVAGVVMFGYLQGWFTRTKNTQETEKSKWQPEVTPESIRVTTETLGEETAQAEQKEQEQRAREQRELEEFQATKRLCEEKGVNLFNYIAAQDKNCRQRLVKNISADDIREYWPGKSPLPLWEEENELKYACLVSGSSCSSFQEFSELLDLVGKMRFDYSAKRAYIDSAPNVSKKFELIRLFNLDCNYNGLLYQCVAELDQVTTLEMVGQIDSVMQKIVEILERTDTNRNFYSKRGEREERRELLGKKIAVAEARIIENACAATDDLDLLACLANRARNITYKCLSDAIEEQSQTITKIVLKKLLGLCTNLGEVERLVTSKEWLSYSQDERVMIDSWFVAAVAKCESLEAINDFQSAMSAKQIKLYGGLVNRRAVQLQLA